MPGMPLVAGPRLPFGVRPIRSVVQVQLSGRLVSSPSSVRSSGPRPDAAVRPAGVQPVRRPAVWCLSVRPVATVSSASAGWWRRGQLGTAGSGHDWIESSSVWSGPVPGGSVDGPRRPGCGHRCGGRLEAGGGVSTADLGRVVLGREATADRPGRPDRRGGALSLATALGQGSWLASEVAARHRVGGQLAWSRDYSAWSLRSLTTERTGPEGPNEVSGGDGVRPQRGPGR